jgi:hypothetical protein
MLTQRKLPHYHYVSFWPHHIPFIDAATSPSVLQNKISNYGSDTSSIYSSERTDTEDESGDIESPYHREESTIRDTYWEHQLDPRKLIDVSKLGLNNLPSDAAMKLIAALDVVFQSWDLPIASFPNAPGANSTSIPFGSSASQTEHGGNAPTTRYNKRDRVTQQDSDEEEIPDPDDNNPRKRKKLDAHQKWACPFYQRQVFSPNEPGGFRECAKNPGFKEVHRIK